MGMPEGKMLNEDLTGFIDIPVAEPEAKKEEPKKETEVAKPEKEEEEEKPKEGEPAKGKETEEEEEEEEEAPAPAAGKEKEKEEEEVVVGIDEHLTEKYGEDYGIKSEEDLSDFLGTIKEMEEELTTTKAELETLKKDGGKIKFESDQEEKAFNFIKNLGVDRFGEGMKTYSTLVTLDLEKADPRILLEEQFINENPELTRDEALRKFNKDYNKKYTASRDAFDTEKDYEEAVTDLKIDLKADAAKAKRYLAQKQKEFIPKQKEADSKVVESNEAIQKGIRTHDSEVSEFFSEFNTITFSPTEDAKDDFAYKLSKEQLKQVQTAMKGWIGNPTSYDDKGKLIGWTDVESKAQEVASMLFYKDMIAKALNHGVSTGEIKKVEQIAKVKPTRTSKVASTADPINEMDQWKDLAKKAAEDRKRKQYS